MQSRFESLLLWCAILFYSIYSILSHSTLFHSTLLCPIPFYSIPFHPHSPSFLVIIALGQFKVTALHISYVALHFYIGQFKNWLFSFSLWLRTVNALCHPEKATLFSRIQPFTDEEITKDPLVILRCDKRIFRYIIY